MTLRRSTVFALLFLAACSGSADSVRTSPTGDPLDADWLDGDSTISPAHLRRILDIGARDPEVAPILTEAVARLGGGSVDGLAARFSPCAPDVVNEGGFTKVLAADAIVTRGLDDIALGRRSPETTKQLADMQRGPSREMRVIVDADFVRVEKTLLPEICIVARAPVIAAYEAVVHELTHALRIDPRAKKQILAATSDERSYLLAFVQTPGGEVDAYTVSERARARLGYRGQFMSATLALLGPRAYEVLAQREAFAGFILTARPAGLGYADGMLRGAYASARAEAHEEAAQRREMTAALLASRRQTLGVLNANVEIHKKNIGIHQYNLGLAQQQGNQAAVARARAGIADSQRGLAEAQAMIAAEQASEARLTADLARWDAELAALGT